MHCQDNLPSPIIDDQDSSLNSFSRLIPADKKLSSQWVESLTSQRDTETFSAEQLTHIGMPIGGIFTGQVYLGGDGELWHWDIFKDYGGAEEHADPRGPHYAKPLVKKSPIEQGFALQIGEDIISLNQQGFADIKFRGQYPVGTVTYADKALPVDVKLQAYSPFIPLDSKNSGLPLTVLEYTIDNTSAQELEVSLLGWLENKVCPYDSKLTTGQRRNVSLVAANYTGVTCETNVPSGVAGSGSMSLVILNNNEVSTATAKVHNFNRMVSSDSFAEPTIEVNVDTSEQLIGGVKSTVKLAPNSKHTFTAVISWYYPEYTGGEVLFATLGEDKFYSSMELIDGLKQKKRFYASFLESSSDAIDYFVEHQSYLVGNTKRWLDTWYDSTLSPWLLDRTFLNTSILATGTCHRFDDGRFWAWEGVDSCPGTCQHVWQYAQAVAKIFPDIERDLRTYTDYGIAYYPDGSLDYRAEASQFGVPAETDLSKAKFAADGQLGTILRVYREHRNSDSMAFLTEIWPKVKRSMQFMMTLDSELSGIIDAPQYNTLDVIWHGKIPWITSLYLAALAASEAMSLEMDDDIFAKECADILAKGQRNFVKQLYNGEYFVHRADVNEPDSMNLTEGSYIDQVFGQSFAFQVGLGRVLPERETRSALNAIFKYNYVQDVGPYRQGFTDILGGRWYAMPGEGGTIMCTWPKQDCAKKDPILLGLDVTSEGYLNECMAGFEYQVASHMIAEDMVVEGLSLTKSIHDRYHPSKRNPWNEIECGDHYSRSMASYGVFTSLSGFNYHGPKQHMSFAPKITPNDFKSAFTAAKGWGSYSQKLVNSTTAQFELALHYGQLNLTTVDLPNLLNSAKLKVQIEQDGQPLDCRLIATEQLQLRSSIELTAGATIVITVTALEA